MKTVQKVIKKAHKLERKTARKNKQQKRALYC